MGRRGPKSSAPGGYGTISAKGYRRVWCQDVGREGTGKRRYRMEHVVIWERYNGPVPDGYHIHHRDGDKLNNDIGNLEMVTPLSHKRHHSGCEWRGDEWWKPCRKCGAWHAVSHYYERVDGISSWCRACHVANATENKRKRKARR